MKGRILGFDEEFYISSGELRTFSAVEFEALPPPNTHFHLYSQSMGKNSFVSPDYHALETNGEAVTLFRPRIDPGGISQIPSGETVRCSEIHFSLDRIIGWLDHTIPDELKPLLSDSIPLGLAVPLPLLAAHQNLTQLMTFMPYSGTLRNMALEGAAMQMVSCYLDFMASSSPRHWPGLVSREERATLQAREILLSDLRNPPGMNQLADMVGMSPRRLNAGFKETFGLSIFQLLHHARLEYARSALKAGGISVKEVAYATGYNHVSNFSAAFRARFGSPPTHVDSDTNGK